jgi:hypothetical protein
MQSTTDDQYARVVLIAGLLNTVIQNQNSDDKSMHSIHFFDGEVQFQRDGDMAVNTKVDNSLYNSCKLIVNQHYDNEWAHFLQSKSSEMKAHEFLHLHRLATLLKESDRPKQYEKAEQLFLRAQQNNELTIKKQRKHQGRHL